MSTKRPRLAATCGSMPPHKSLTRNQTARRHAARVSRKTHPWLTLSPISAPRRPRIPINVPLRGRDRAVQVAVQLVECRRLHRTHDALAISLRVVVGLAALTGPVRQVGIAGDERNLVAAEPGVAHHADLAAQCRKVHVSQCMGAIDERDPVDVRRHVVVRESCDVGEVDEGARHLAPGSPRPQRIEVQRLVEPPDGRPAKQRDIAFDIHRPERAIEVFLRAARVVDQKHSADLRHLVSLSQPRRRTAGGRIFRHAAETLASRGGS